MFHLKNFLDPSQDGHDIIQDGLSGLNDRTRFRYGFSLSKTALPSVWHDYSITAQVQTNQIATTSVTTTDKITGTYYLWILICLPAVVLI